jgi:hypothetical protein
MASDRKQRLIRLIENSQLNDRNIDRIESFLQSLTAGPTYESINPNSDIADKKFLEEVSEELLLHHAKHSEPINKLWFEYILVKGLVASGRDARRLEVSEMPPADVFMDGKLLSAKTEASKTIRSDKVLISKLNEAKWIRDCKSGEDCVDGICDNVVPKLKICDRTLVFRAFRERAGLIRYELEEIPQKILLAMKNLKAEDFGKPTPNNTRSAKVRLGGRVLFTLTLDGSVEKIRIRGLSTSNCMKHAVLRIPTTQQRSLGD